QDTEKVLEASRKALRTIVFLRVDVAELAGRGDKQVFAGLNVDAGVDPGLFTGQLDFLRKTLFPLRNVRGGGVLGFSLGRRLRRAEIESATGPSEDCGKRHERTSKTDRTGWIVLGIRFARGCASTVAGSRTSAITSSASGPGARPAAAHTDRSAQHRER